MDLKNKIKKAYIDLSPEELINAPVHALFGVSENDAVLLQKAFNIKTVKDLAKLKYARWAREICNNADSDTVDLTSLKEMVVKKYEKKSPKMLVKAPVDALQGLSKKDANLMKKAFRIKTVQDLAKLKYIKWAEEIVEFSQAAFLKKTAPIEKKVDKNLEEEKGKGGIFLKLLFALVLIGAIVMTVLYFPNIKKFLKKDQAAPIKPSKVETEKPMPIEKIPEKEVVTKPVEEKIVKKPIEKGFQEYVVQPKDQLTNISEKLFGDYTKWKVIYEANKDTIKNPNLIFPGQKLRIPEKK